jgi:hypothetical protein
MRGRFLVLEYENSATMAYINRNDFNSDRIVERFIMDKSPIETAKEYGLMKHKLESELDAKYKTRIDKLISEQQARLGVLSTQIEKQKGLIGRLRDKIYSQGVIHAEGKYSKMCRPTFYGFRKTIDFSFVTCKKCLEALDKEALLKKQWEERHESV